MRRNAAYGRGYIQTHVSAPSHATHVMWRALPQLQPLSARYNLINGCSTVVLIIGFTCPAITVVTVILRALVRVRERALIQKKLKKNLGLSSH